MTVWAAAQIAALPGVMRARQALHASDDLTLAEMVEIAEIPAPPFGEERRGRWIADRFRSLGLTDVSTDEVGNVVARYPRVAGAAANSSGAPRATSDEARAGRDDIGAVLVAAHLDTVFPEGTDHRVRREGDRFIGPGITDNARGLAAMLALARVMVGAGVEVERPLAFVATVGEEGIGDLRGVKHLLRDGSPWRAASAFIALDGTGLGRIVHRGVGSTRFRVVVKGPGGHSWADWGTVNPVHVIGAAIASLAGLRSTQRPRTTLTVARVWGGTSINSIPTEAGFDVDLRGDGAAALAALERRAIACVENALDRANARRPGDTPPASIRFDTLGRRPTGATAATSPLVVAAENATRLVGAVPELVAASTDANVAMSLGIPAITLGAGGESGGTHTTSEWYANVHGPEGLERVLLTVLSVAGVRDSGQS